ncbi:hypothetical protein Zmor_015157 [Zophobas morio]|uniref:THAP-type domain-containing protein n=1 Tax=Zophobas morio TaxID=2755281 RepID=A0AA38MGZ8_9CUCU|nr:hypothetical protein Zmor_015121 [Zophobas morio]KAJ3656054.1 hypothetical protein Zmor_015157 [Zophobas morio]
MNRSGRPRLYCAVRDCKHNEKTCFRGFFIFPSEPARFKLWALNCARRDLINKGIEKRTHYRVCGCHFVDKMFCNVQKNRLQRDAAPTKLIELWSKTRENSYMFGTKIAESKSKKPCCAVFVFTETKE